MSNLDEHYRAQAALCRELATKARTQQAAAEFLNLANIWLGLAAGGVDHIKVGTRVRPNKVQQISPTG